MTITEGGRGFPQPLSESDHPKASETRLAIPSLAKLAVSGFAKRAVELRQLQVTQPMDNPTSGQTEWRGRIAGMASAAVWAGYVSNRQIADVARLAATQESRRRAILESDAAGDSEGHSLRYDQFERRQPEPKKTGAFPTASEPTREEPPRISTRDTAATGDMNRVRIVNRVDYQA